MKRLSLWSLLNRICYNGIPYSIHILLSHIKIYADKQLLGDNKHQLTWQAICTPDTV